MITPIKNIILASMAALILAGCGEEKKTTEAVTPFPAAVQAPAPVVTGKLVATGRDAELIEQLLTLQVSGDLARCREICETTKSAVSCRRRSETVCEYKRDDPLFKKIDEELFGPQQ